MSASKLLIFIFFEKSASMRSEKQLSAIIGVLVYLFGFLICSGVLSSVLDFDFGSIDGCGKFSLAVLIGCIVGFLYMLAGKNARSFWLGRTILYVNFVDCFHGVAEGSFIGTLIVVKKQMQLLVWLGM